MEDELRQVGKTTRSRDLIFTAKRPGKRISAKRNSKGGKRYYEYRANRSDKSAKKRL